MKPRKAKPVAKVMPASKPGKFDATIALLKANKLRVKAPKAYKPTFADRRG